VDTVAQIFTKLTYELNFPMFIVTTAVGDRRGGCMIGFATQTSVHQGRFLACLSRKNRTLPVAAGHGPGELLYFDDVRHIEPGHQA